jgi:hypothetical protein
MSKSRLVLAAIAIFAASVLLGGVAVAVGTTDKVAACTSHKHVRVLGTKVKCRSGEKRIAWRVQGKPGPTGARGPAGPRGATGGIGNVHTVNANSPALAAGAGAVSEVSVWCPQDQQVVGGGFTFANQEQHDVVQGSNPVVDPNGLQGWHVKIVAVEPTGGINHYVRAYALCAAT